MLRYTKRLESIEDDQSRSDPSFFSSSRSDLLMARFPRYGTPVSARHNCSLELCGWTPNLFSDAYGKKVSQLWLPFKYDQRE